MPGAIRSSLPGTGPSFPMPPRLRNATAYRNGAFFYRGDESCLRTEVARYQQNLSRLRLGKNVLIVIDGTPLEGYDEILLFKPPFGPYPPELRETFPIGPCELPDWDERMVRQGCRGIRSLAESHVESRIEIACSPAWAALVQEELGEMETADDTV